MRCVCLFSIAHLSSLNSLSSHGHPTFTHGLQHIDTPDNTVETKFDFNEENYKRVEMVSFDVVCGL